MKKKRGVGSKLEQELKGNLGPVIFVLLVILNLILGGVSLSKEMGVFIPQLPIPIIMDNAIDLDELSLEQKIAQMVISLGIRYNTNAFRRMQIGGVHLHAMQAENVFKDVVNSYQRGMEIPFFITVDLEGCVSPFAYYKEFPPVNEIESLGASFEKGKEEGKYLAELGVNLNFAPVVDLDDQIWKCRSFPGNQELISELANAYILGIQDEGVLATAKHYPGKTLVIKDPHKYLTAAEISEDDLYPYRSLADKGNVKAIMVSHLITFGEVNSEGKPSVASKEIIDGLRKDFDGLIITDEINMLGVKNFYDDIDEMYLDVFKAGSDLILNFNDDVNEIKRMIKIIEEGVLEGVISQERIDNSVRRILEAKGFMVR